MPKKEKKEKVLCLNCGAEMKAGKKTRTRVMEYAEYVCPKGCRPWSKGRSLDELEPVGEVDVEVVETEEESDG